MPAIELLLLPSLLAACLVLAVGGFLAQRVPFQARYSIPAPIIGGLIFAVLGLLANRISRRLAGPLLIILAAQTVLVAGRASWVTFPLVGRDYESAIISGAFCGFAMGGTATAISNIQALTRRRGPSPQAFVNVPIVGAFFIDLSTWRC
jgi:Na+/glutamate symporter